MKVDIFIKQSKLLFNQLGKKIRIVIDNQSADLDSIVSAISLAFYLNQVDAEKNFNPIINWSKSIISTKKPRVHLFQHLSVDLEDLLFIGYLKRDWLNDLFQRFRRTRDWWNCWLENLSAGWSIIIWKRVVSKTVNYVPSTPELVQTRASWSTWFAANKSDYIRHSLTWCYIRSN